MDTTPCLNGQQNSQWHQQTLSQAGCSNTQYSAVNYSQSTQFNPGYGAYYSGQTSNHPTSTSAQLLPSNTVHHLPNHFVHGNANLQTSYQVAQMVDLTVPRQWQVSKTTPQTATSNVNWSNQRPPTRMAQAPYNQNMQYSGSNCFTLNSNTLNDAESPQTSMPQNASKESNTTLVKKYKSLQTHSKTSKEDAPPPPYTASKKQMPAYKPSRSKRHDATFNSSSGQLPRYQTFLPLQSSVGKAPSFNKSPVNLAPVSNNLQLSQTNNDKLPQTSHSSVNQCNAGSPPLSISHQKAVAVVPPLSQQGNEDQVTTKKSCPEMTGQHKDTPKDRCDYSKLYTNYQHIMKYLLGDNPPQNNDVSSGIPSELKDPLNGNVAPTADGIVTTDYGIVTTTTIPTVKKSEDASATLLSNGNGKQSKAQQSVTIEASQREEIDKSMVQASESVNELFHFTWTYDKLRSLIALSTSLTKIQPQHSNHVIARIVSCLWDNDLAKLLSMMRTDHYKQVMFEVINFCKDTTGSPILSQLESNSWPRLKKNFTVLDHDVVYSESPYVSPWLNVNKQLDDIDKEFGFPSSLTIREQPCNTETEPMETNDCIPVGIVKEPEVEKEPQMAPALEDVVENVESVLPTKCSHSMVPDDSVDLIDPLYLLEIHVMPPDEARTVFEQLQNESLKPMLELKSKEMSTTEETTSLEEYCCVIRWKEVYSGMEPSGKCCCTSLESNMPGVISIDSLLDPSEEGDIIDVSFNPVQSNSSVSRLIAFTEKIGVKQKVDCHLPIAYCHPATSMDLTEEEEILNDILRTVNGESISTPALEEGCIKVDLQSACPAETLIIEPKQAQDHDNAPAQSNGNHIKMPRDNHSPSSKAVLNIDQKPSNCNLHDLKSITSSLTMGPTRLSHTARPKDDYSSNLKKRPSASSELYTRPKVRVRRDEDSVPSVSQSALGYTSNNIIKEKVDADYSMAAAKTTVKLALFGSLPQRKGNCGKNYTSGTYFSAVSHQPPSVLILTRSPVKRRLSEEWEKSYLPITKKKLKNKTIKDVNGNSASATVTHGRRKWNTKDFLLETSEMSKNRMTKKVNLKTKSKSKKYPDVPLK